jgi:Tfp pilus assembly protein PilV
MRRIRPSSKMNAFNGKDGFTLLELMIGGAILIVGIIGILAVFAYCYGLNETSRNIAQAVNDGRALLEAMRDESAAGISNVANTNWNLWAKSTGPTASGKTNSVPLTSLTQEDITTAISGSDPLRIILTVNWIERGGRQGQIQLVTLMTQR